MSSAKDIFNEIIAIPDFKLLSSFEIDDLINAHLKRLNVYMPEHVKEKIHQAVYLYGYQENQKFTNIFIGNL